jgi:hypothetical protein
MRLSVLVTLIVDVFVISFAGFANQTNDECTVREALEVQYAKLAEANAKKDLKAILGLRAPNFSTVGPDGKKHSKENDAAYVMQLESAMELPIRLSNIIIGVKVQGDEGAATVFQRLERRQSLGGKVRNVLTSVIQTETWVKMADGWKIKFVENAHNRRWYVDGKRIDPNKPFDPAAPPYNPDLDTDLGAN